MSLVFPYLPAGQGGGGVSVVPWTKDIDNVHEEIAAMIAAADAGQIVLSDYWSVGDERTVHLSAMTAGDGLNNAQPAQDVALVLMDTGANSGYKDVNDKTVNFVVGQKGCLTEKGRMNTTQTSVGSWNGCAMRTDLNNKYYNALPAPFKACLKQFKTITAETYNGSTNQISNDYIALFAEKEIFDSVIYSNSTEADALKQIKYYETTTNRLKSAYWWERSPTWIAQTSFCYVTSGGDKQYCGAANLSEVSPFMCI